MVAALIHSPLAATEWTIDALINLPVISDPQIRPDGKAYAYVLRELDAAHNKYRTSIRIGPIPFWVFRTLGGSQGEC